MKKRKPNRIEQEQQYIAFLEKRVASKNFRANVSKEEYNATKAKLKKARLVLKLLQSGDGR